MSKIDGAFLSRYARNREGTCGAKETETHDTGSIESLPPVVKCLPRGQTTLPTDDEGLWQPLN